MSNKNQSLTATLMQPIPMTITISLIIVFVALVGYAYTTNGFGFLGICAPGEKQANWSCYSPTGLSGKRCYSKNDCGDGYCRWDGTDNNSKKRNVGVCVDTQIGCYKWFDGSGQLSGTICRE